MADRVDEMGETVAGLRDVLAVRSLHFNRLADGHISVCAETPPGTRLAYRQTVLDEDFALRVTRYNPSTVANRTAGGLLRNSFRGSNFVLVGVTSLAGNAWTFGTDPGQGATFWDRTVKNREFWVSAAVGFAVSVVAGASRLWYHWDLRLQRLPRAKCGGNSLLDCQKIASAATPPRKDTKK